jgi:hypothetical protein
MVNAGPAYQATVAAVHGIEVGVSRTSETLNERMEALSGRILAAAENYSETESNSRDAVRQVGGSIYGN